MDYDAILKEWINRLGLNDWEIKLFPCCKPEEMTDEAVGCTVWEEAIKCARIEILDPDYYGDRMVPFNWEKTLVHELLHIKTCLLTSDCSPLKERIGHQLIDDLARAFISTKYGTNLR